MKSILFLGGGQLGIPTIEWAKEIGFNIIVNDRAKDAPGIKLADVGITYDSTDSRGLTTWALKNNRKYNIQYCYCGSDFGLLTAANLHNALEIKFPSIKAIINGLDKRLMKDCWANAVIKYPKSIIINSYTQIKELNQKLSLPVVLKPSSSSGSRGVSIISNKNKLLAGFNEATKYSDDKNIMLEDYIEGSHHDVNGLFWNGDFFPCGIGDRFFTPIPFPVPEYGFYPSTLSENIQKVLYKSIENGARGMGICHGPVKGDCVVKDNQAFIYEISPRFHGDIFTSNMQGYLEKLNPIYQLLKFIYFNDDYKFQDIIDNATGVGGWRVITNNIKEISKLPNKGVWENPIINTSKYVKNNTEISGLAWFWANDKPSLYKKMGIRP